MPRRLGQRRVTLSDLEWPFHASRAISTVAELLVSILVPFLPQWRHQSWARGLAPKKQCLTLTVKHTGQEL